MGYREYRNLEASIIDYITTELNEDGWLNIRIEKSFSQVYEGSLPCICINQDSSEPRRKEIGSDSYIEYMRLSIRIFATNDGQRLDLAAWFISKLFSGCIYYKYTISDGIVSEKSEEGRINILRIVENRKELVNTERLEQIDKYRHLITVECLVAIN